MQARTDQAPGHVAGPDVAAAGFEAFFRANYPAVLRLAQNVVRGAGAQDVAQEVFLAAYRRFPHLSERDDERAAGWVRVATVHTALNVVRRERRQGRLSSLMGRSGDLPSAEDVVLEREARVALREALGRMPTRAATLLVLRHSGFSYLEVAEAIGVKSGQVGTLLRRAESALRKEMERASHR